MEECSVFNKPAEVAVAGNCVGKWDDASALNFKVQALHEVVEQLDSSRYLHRFSLDHISRLTNNGRIRYTCQH